MPVLANAGTIAVAIVTPGKARANLLVYHSVRPCSDIFHNKVPSFLGKS